MSVFLGTRYLTSVDGEQGQKISVALSTSTKLSPTQLVLGGIPLSLYDLGDGRYALAVIIEASTHSNGTTVWKGNTIQLGTVDSLFSLSVVESNLSHDVVDETVLAGIPLGVTESGSLLVKQVTIPSYDEQTKVYIGGMPLLVRQHENNWYLVICV